MLVPTQEEELGKDEALNEENVPAQSSDPPLSRVNTLGSGEDRLKLQELMKLCTKLESSAEEPSLGEEDAFKQGRNIADIDADAETILVDETAEDQGRYDDQEMFDTNVLNDEEVVVEDIIAATTTTVSIDDITLAQVLVEIKTSNPKARDYELAARLQEEEQRELTIEEKLKLFVELMDKRKKHFAKFRAEEQRRKPPTKVQKRNQMCVYLKNMVGFTHKSEVMKDKAVLTQESSSKRAGDKLDQGRFKKQKVEDDKEQEELNKCMEIISDDEDDVTIDATPLSIKTLIIYYKIYKKGKKSYFQVFRADGNS
uniref:Uncharacterized protein n=1 Tax=Tanacetum cinerariifolium TaxID=118510 RepID=A0A699HT33_TANCI|nr:hypothetical protein [Tanacetum cinerariifolium]